jgi:hypothetical protein
MGEPKGIVEIDGHLYLVYIRAYNAKSHSCHVSYCEKGEWRTAFIPLCEMHGINTAAVVRFGIEYENVYSDGFSRTSSETLSQKKAASA